MVRSNTEPAFLYISKRLKNFSHSSSHTNLYRLWIYCLWILHIGYVCVVSNSRYVYLYFQNIRRTSVTDHTCVSQMIRLQPQIIRHLHFYIFPKDMKDFSHRSNMPPTFLYISPKDMKDFSRRSQMCLIDDETSARDHTLPTFLYISKRYEGLQPQIIRHDPCPRKPG